MEPTMDPKGREQRLLEITDELMLLAGRDQAVVELVEIIEPEGVMGLQGNADGLTLLAAKMLAHAAGKPNGGPDLLPLFPPRPESCLAEIQLVDVTRDQHLANPPAQRRKVSAWAQIGKFVGGLLVAYLIIAGLVGIFYWPYKLLVEYFSK